MLTGLGTIEITGGTLTLLNNVIPNLQLAGGSVTLGGNFQSGIITNLTLTSGTLAGNNIVSGVLNTGANLTGSLTVLPGATVNWTGGSSIQGPIYVAPGALLTLTSGSTMHLYGALTNAGTVTWPGSGQLEIDYSSAANEFGFIQNLPGALFDLQSSATLANGFPGANGAYFQNAGTLRKLGDSGVTTFSLPFYNSGMVTDGQGTLAFTHGGVIQSAFSAATGATVNFASGDFADVTPPVVTGLGTVALTGGTLTLLNNIIPNLQLQGGIVTLAPTFQGGVITNLTMSGGTLLGNTVVNGVFNTGAGLPGSLAVQSGATVTWTGGSMQGPVTIASGGSFSIAGGAGKSLLGPMTNSGTVTWTGSGDLEVDNSSGAGEFGLIQNLPGGLWDVQTDQSHPRGRVFSKQRHVPEIRGPFSHRHFDSLHQQRHGEGVAGDDKFQRCGFARGRKPDQWDWERRVWPIRLCQSGPASRRADRFLARRICPGAQQCVHAGHLPFAHRHVRAIQCPIVRHLADELRPDGVDAVGCGNRQTRHPVRPRRNDQCRGDPHAVGRTSRGFGDEQFRAHQWAARHGVHRQRDGYVERHRDTRDGRNRKGDLQ